MAKIPIDLEVEAFLALPTSRKLVEALKSDDKNSGFNDFQTEEEIIGKFWEALGAIGYTKEAHRSGSKPVPDNLFRTHLRKYVRQHGVTYNE